MYWSDTVFGIATMGVPLVAALVSALPAPFYTFARKEYEKAGRKIIDATLDGKCQVFEKADYLDVLYRKP